MMDMCSAGCDVTRPPRNTGPDHSDAEPDEQKCGHERHQQQEQRLLPGLDDDPMIEVCDRVHLDPREKSRPCPVGSIQTQLRQAVILRRTAPVVRRASPG